METRPPAVGPQLRSRRIGGPIAPALSQAVPGPATRSMTGQMYLLRRRPKMILDGVPAGARGLGSVHDSNALTLTRQFEDRGRQLRQVAQEDAFTLDLALEPLLLALQAPQEKLDPRIPVLLSGPDRALRATKREVIGFLVLLDDTFERAVRHVGVTSPKEQQSRQGTRQATIAVLERMDFEKNHNGDSDDEEGVESAIRLLGPLPGHQF